MKVCIHSIKTADDNICGECEEEYTEHETEYWIYDVQLAVSGFSNFDPKCVYMT